MKDRYIYRCPVCGAFYTHTKNAYSPLIRKAKKKEVFLSESELEAIRAPKEKPTFNLLDPDKDTMVIWKRGNAILGKFNWLEAYLNLPQEELGFFRKKLQEIEEQIFKIFKILNILNNKDKGGK